MWRSRWRCVIKPAYSFSFLLSINIFLWQTVLYFLDAPRMKDFWYTEQQILWTVQSNRTSCCGRTDRVVQVVFRQYNQKKQKIWHQNLQTLWLSGLHLWYEHVFRQTTATFHNSNHSNARNCAATYSRSWGTGPQNFHGQLFHLAWSVWWSVPTKNQCVWNSSPRQAWNAMR